MRSVLDGLGIPRHLSACHAPLPHQLLAAPRLMTAFGGAGLPSSADTRLVEPYDVKDQGDKGTCVTQGVTSAAEFVLKRYGVTTRLSRLWIYAKGRERELTPLSEDSGLVIADAVSLLTENGCPDETEWPYDLSKWSDAPPLEVDASAHHRLKLPFHCPDRATMRASIAHGFPVAFGLSVFQSFMSPEVAATGEVHYPEPGENAVGGHCMLAVGYDDSLKRDDLFGAFTVLNSWGDGWGRAGYCTVPYHYIDDFGFDAWTLRSEDPR